MAPDAPDRKPGQFAEERFRSRRRAWRRRVGGFVLAGAAFVFAASIVIALVLDEDLGFYAGFGLGSSIAILFLLDSPPHYIERWRAGAEGERRTARAMRPLVRDGWILLNDLPRTFGNIDHVAIGPPGVFLLETKNLHGAASVADDRLSVHWIEDPDDGYDNDTIAGRARGSAAALSRDVAARTGKRPWVQSVVVLWARFDQGFAENNRVVWTSGDRLVDALRARGPARLDSKEIDQIAGQIRAIAANGRDQPLSG